MQKSGFAASVSMTRIPHLSSAKTAAGASGTCSYWKDVGLILMRYAAPATAPTSDFSGRSLLAVGQTPGSS